MSIKRVTVFGMHENEVAQALQLVKSPIEAGNLVIGEMDDAEIEKARSEGLVVQVRPDAPDRPKTVQSKPPLGTRLADTLGFTMMRGFAPLPQTEVPAEVDYYVLDLDSPLLEQTRTALEAAGASIIAALPDGGYEIRAKNTDVADIQSVQGVVALSWLSPEATPVETITQGAPTPDTGQKPQKMLTYDVRLRDTKDLATIRSWLQNEHVDIAGSSGRKIRFFALENAPILAELAARPEIDAVAEYIEPTLYNEAACKILGTDGLKAIAQPAVPLDGSGEIVAIADTGIDDTHPDFAGRIKAKFARGRAGATDDPHGHGTHVAGSAVGDGTASGGILKGAAPKAELIFQSLIDAGGGLGGLPLDLNDLFLEAYNAGARIHNNSWGNKAGSAYMINSEEVDEFVQNHPDMLIVVAAGNEGDAAATTAQHGGAGWVDWLSICAPASSKNAITVGASRSDRTDGPNAANTFGALWPSRFPASPTSGELVSGDAQCLAAFSSRGPCTDRRIKPDVVAPGTDIASTKSALAPMSNFVGAYPATAGAAANPRYAYDCGTSMAAPFVAGCAALVRQYYVRGATSPSAALLKATLVNGTVWLTGADSTAPTAGSPNYHQGHGRVDLSRSVPNATVPNFVLFFHDDWKTGGSLTKTGDVIRYQVTVPPDCDELRMCIAYTDLPARGLQNNLNIIAQRGGGNSYVGNADLPDAITSPDVDNNLETIRIVKPDPPVCTTSPSFAANILKGPQPVAFVVTGTGLSGFTSY